MNKSWDLIKFTYASDKRGDLVAVDFNKQLPFCPKRFFTTFNVPNSMVRGEHAHLECEQVLVAIKGKIKVFLSDGINSEEFHLEDPTVGLYVPALIWGTQTSQSSGSILGVFASLPYDESDYIRNYAQFLERIAR
jgi:UDP-2-acetamido-3-amino-2,3-dideoxy-glucuronate N-acetyltransferase